MKTLYIECKMGAAGDMLMGALTELIPSKADFVEKMNAIGMPGIEVTAEETTKCGVKGTHVHVFVHGEEEGCEHEHEHHHHEHEHHSMADIENIIDGLKVSDKVKSDAKEIYKLIAAAESDVHGLPVCDVHFHEVGAMDAIADIVGNCMLMEEIGAEKIVASPINVGSGSVKCAHGILPVPAPATCEILKGIPYYSNDIDSELCTPTGAAILRYFAESFGSMPLLKMEKVGAGMGNKDFIRANCIRVFMGEDAAAGRDTVCELSANLDDMTGEAIGFAAGTLLAEGALDAYTTPITMKKSRPAVMLSCICKQEDADRMAALMLKHTTTAGVRKQVFERYILDRTEEVKHTPDGDVRVKKYSGCGVSREKAEYDDIARIAKETGKSLEEIKW